MIFIDDIKFYLSQVISYSRIRDFISLSRSFIICYWFNIYAGPLESRHPTILREAYRFWSGYLAGDRSTDVDLCTRHSNATPLLVKVERAARRIPRRPAI